MAVRRASARPCGALCCLSARHQTALTYQALYKPSKNRASCSVKGRQFVHLESPSTTRSCGGSRFHANQWHARGRPMKRPRSTQAYQSRRCNPSIKSKCRSRLKMGRLCCRHNAAIQASLEGIGVPASLTQLFRTPAQSRC